MSKTGWILLAVLWAGWTLGGEMVLKVPADMKVTAAVARAGEEKIRGEIAGGEIRFAEVKG